LLNLIHGDCMDVMLDYPDNYFDLAVVDPPYGIGAEHGTNRASKSNIQFKNKKLGWDSQPPPREYFVGR
jgi:site-specific DNA-methyltransferase (adenine-specific)